MTGLYVNTLGEGPRVVLVHGSGGSSQGGHISYLLPPASSSSSLTVGDMVAVPPFRS